MATPTSDRPPLAGVPWLDARRADAAARLALAPLPSADEEVWRYSPIDALDLAAFGPVVAPDLDPDRDRALADALVPDRAALVVVVDGHVATVELADRSAGAGVAVGRATEVATGEAVLGAGAGLDDHFGLLNDAHAPDPVVVDVPRGVALDAPIVVVHRTRSEGALALPRLAVRLGDGAQATVVDLQVSDDVVALTVPVVELEVGAAARLGYLGLQDLGPQVWQLATQTSRVGAQAHLLAATAAFGGGYARLRTDCALTGRGASGDLLAAYFGDGDQTLDFRTFQDHVAPDTTSNLLFKGAVGGRSRSVYTGLIRVRPDARGTNAFQTNRNVKLSEHAWAESVPNLEIENNDVRCSHASTVGPIDEQQRFYLESRGVPTPAAERLIVAGFFDEVLGRLPVPSIAAEARRHVAAKLTGTVA